MENFKFETLLIHKSVLKTIKKTYNTYHKAYLITTLILKPYNDGSDILTGNRRHDAKDTPYGED